MTTLELNDLDRNSSDAASRLGVRRQSGSGDGAFGWVTPFFRLPACESGVAQGFPPQSKTASVHLRSHPLRFALWSAPAECNVVGAFGWVRPFFRLPACESGVAQSFPPQSKTASVQRRSHPGLVLALAAALCFSGCDRAPAPPAKTPAASVSVQTILPKRGPITRWVTLPGEIRPYQQATLYAKVAGYLKTITVDKGDQVQAGALLAEIEVPELLAERARNRAEVEVAEIDYKRLSESQKKAPDLVVPQTVDDARGKLEIAKANLERTETLLQYARITAPFSGVVTRRLVDPGAFIPAATSGSAAQNAALITLTDFNRVRLQVSVPEVEASLVAKGQPVKLTVEGLPGCTFDGQVTRIAYALDEASKTMLAEIELPNPKLELRPGMYASVKIGLERKADALLVPTDALAQEKTGASVFGVADGKAKKIPVKTGFNDGEHVEIVSNLDPGQRLISLGKRAFSDGQPVIVSEGK